MIAARHALVAGLVCAALARAAAGQTRKDPSAGEIVVTATRAVDGDSSGPLRTRWTARLARDPDDRAAALGLLTLARLTYDTADARRRMDALTAPGTPDDAIARYARLGEARVMFASTRWRAAAAAYAAIADAARAAHDSAAEARAALGAAWTAVVMWRPDSLHAWLARAEAVAPARDDAARGANRCVRADLPETPPDSASVWLRQGIAQVERAHDARAAAFCLFRHALMLQHRGEDERCILILTDAIDRARRVHDLDLVATMLEWRGTARVGLGNYGAGQSDLWESIEVGHRAADLPAIGWSESELATVARASRDAPAALRHLERARAALTVLDNPGSLGYIRRVEGWVALDLGDTARARMALTEALAMARTTRIAPDVAGIQIDLANLAVRERRWQSAVAELDSVRAINAGTAWLKLSPWWYGIIALRRGDPATARPQLQAALTVVDTTQHVYRQQIREDLAETWLRLGDTARAIRELEDATAEINRWRSTLSDAELRTLAFQVQPDFGGPSPALAQVIAAAAASGRLDAAFTAAESRRARELADQLAQSEAVVTLAELQRTIPDDGTAIIEYVTGPSGAPTTAFTITRRTASARVLPPADSLDDAITRLDQLTATVGAAPAPARLLGASLLAPVVESLPPGVTHLVILPDGPLHRVPFAVLRLADGRPAVERWAVSTAPSAAVLATLWNRPTTPRDARVLAFGDPIVGDATIGTMRDADADADAEGEDANNPLTLPRLPWTGDEARLVGAFGRGSVVRVRDQATAAYLTRTPLEAFTVIHLATHAVIDDAIPTRSALILTPGGGQSGIIGPGDLAALRLTADMVVLSACRTARGPIVAGEGVRGLAAPLLAAGARTVVATQWAVSDRAIVPVIYDLYRGLARGLDVSNAVREAELTALHHGAPDRQWAALSVIGDPLAHVRVHLPAPSQVPDWLR